MKRTPLRRSKPMRRSAPRRLKRDAGERDYVTWLHTQPCAGHESRHCGPIQQAHLRDMTGIGRKEPARQSAPLCLSLHEQYDQARGYFLGWSKDERKAWMRARIAEANARYDEQVGAA